MMSVKDKIVKAKSSNLLVSDSNKKKLESIRKLALISAEIELARCEKGMNQKEFAKLMGVSQSMISKWESGTYNFTIETLTDICQKLDIKFKPIIEVKKSTEFQGINIDFSSQQQVPYKFSGVGNYKKGGELKYA